MTGNVAHYLCYVIDCYNPGSRIVVAEGVLGCHEHSDEDVAAAVEWVTTTLAQLRRADAQSTRSS